LPVASQGPRMFAARAPSGRKMLLARMVVVLEAKGVAR